MLMKTAVLLFVLIAAATTASSQQVDCREATGDDVLAKLELPTEKVNNFSVNAVKKTKVGFVVKADWGASLSHYQIDLYFRCQRNRFYLYRVKKVSLLTRHPERGYWDTTKTKVTKIRNLPIEKVVITRYL